MKIKRQDWQLAHDAEEAGLLVSMTSMVHRKDTEANRELRKYFVTQMPKYTGVIDEDDCEDVLSNLNAYIEEEHIDHHSLDFPTNTGSDVYLLPVGHNIQLKILIVDEYHGDSDYEKYISFNEFVMTEKTTPSDVDDLITFIKGLAV